MEKIKRDKLVSKIICTVLAIILWFYVSYQENPNMTKTIKNVPLTLIGEQALKENGFSVYSLSEKSVNVSASAKRLTLGRINNKNLTAAVNVSSIKSSGEYVIPATVSSSVNTTASFFVKSKDIKVVIEPIVTRSYRIEPVISDTGDSSLIVRSTELSSKMVTVSAPQSIIKEISAVKTEPVIPDDPEETQKEDVGLTVFAKNGTKLEGAECIPSTVDVTYSFYDVKTVPVVMKLNDGSIYELPASYTAKIYGYGSVFDSVTRIETEPLPVSVLEFGERSSVKLVLPDGVKLLDKTSEIDIFIDKKDISSKE